MASDHPTDTPDAAILLEIRQSIQALPHDEQIHIRAVAQAMRSIIVSDQLAAMAFALVGAEMANQQ